VQAWRSKVSGVVEIVVEVKEKGKGRLSVWKGTNKEGVLLGHCTEEKTYVFTEAVKRGEYMYVATETDNSTEIGESIKAGIRIRYLSYERDELLGRHIDYQLPERLNEKPDKVLQKFYEEKEETDEKGNRYPYWQLKDGDYKAYLDEQAIETILAKGFYAYVGSEVDKEAFEAFYGGMGADAQKEDVKRGVQYDTCFEEYVYTGKEADHTFNTDILEKMSGEQRKKAMEYRIGEGKGKYPLYYKDGAAYYRERLILKTKGEREKGERGYEDEKGIEIGEVEGKKYRLVNDFIQIIR